MPRPVAPDVVAAPPIPTDTLERVEARDPLGDKGRAPSLADLPPAETILRRPVVSAAGTFTSQGHTVALAGIDITDVGEKCGEGTTRWPCGIHARTAFRNYLRGRAMTCVVPAIPGSDVVVADCKLGTQNPAEWLVTQGWARAVAGGPYEEAAAAAQSAHRGLYGQAPTAAPALTITVPESAEPPTSAIGVPPGGSGG